MKLLSQSVLIAAPIKTVWNQLIDWHTWPSWDGGIETISFNGPLELGAVGKLTMKGGAQSDLTISELIKEKSYTSEFDLLGTHFVFVHALEPVNSETRAVFTVEASGISSPAMGMMMKVGLEKEMPGWLDQFRKIIESGLN